MIRSSVGWCKGFADELKHPQGFAWTWSACWAACADKHGYALVAIDGPGDGGDCYCQDACDSRSDCGEDSIMTRDDFELAQCCDGGSGGGDGSGANCAPDGFTIHWGVGFCDGMDIEIYHPAGLRWTWSECWNACEAQYPGIVVAIDGPQDGDCYCQDACDQLDGCDDASLMVKSDVKIPLSSCFPDGFVVRSSVGWCNGFDDELKHPQGFAWTWSACWAACADKHGYALVAIDGPGDGGDCYCQDACDSRSDCGEDSIMTRDDFELAQCCDGGSGGGDGSGANCAPDGFTIHWGVGFCDGMDIEIYHPAGLRWTWSECWNACEAQYPGIVVAIDGPQDGDCYCQDACDQLDGCDDASLMVKSDVQIPTCTSSTINGIA